MHKLTHGILSLTKYLNRINLSRVEFVTVQGKAYVRKKPLWYSPVFRIVANELLRYRCAPVQVLRKNEWHRRELFIYNSLYQKEAYVDEEKRLLMEKLDGETLRAILSDYGRKDEDRLRALRLAVQAMETFHRFQSNESGMAVHLSHSDATVNNVLVDLSGQQALWIDFDLIHLEGIPTPLRQADDLRSLIFSSISHFSRSQIPLVLHEVLQTYQKPSVLQALRDEILPSSLDWDYYHWAQSRILPEIHELCRNSLINLLRTNG